MYAIVNDTRLFFDIEGSGFVPEGRKLREKPTCFVLHGGPGGDHTVYKPHLTPLSDLMQLVYTIIGEVVFQKANLHRPIL